MIRVENLSTNYDRLDAVRNIPFEMNEGEIFAFWRPNGAYRFSRIEV